MFDYILGIKGKEKIFRKLEKELIGCAKPILPTNVKKNLKAELMSAIKENRRYEYAPAGLKSLGFKITRIASGVNISRSEISEIKERVMASVERMVDTGVSERFFRKNGFFRTALSSMLLFTFVVSSLFVFPLVPTTYARSSYIDELDGEVYVLRGGESIQGKVSLLIEEGDVVLTKGNSYVSVHFFDDSLGRLGENTNVEVKRLYSEPLNPVATDIELFLNQGRLWAKVVSLVDENSSFKVETDEVEASVQKKAAFDVDVKEDSTKITVFDNVVNVKRLDNNETPSKTVVAGFQAQIPHNDGSDIKLSVTKEQPSQPGQKWVAGNLKSDSEYDNELQSQKEKKLSTEVAANILSVNQPVSTATSGKSGSRVEASRQSFLNAYSKLLKAETLLARGADSGYNKLLRDFRDETDKIFADLPELMKEDELNATLLKGMIDEKIGMQLKDMSAFLPDNKLYRAKDTLREVELQAAGSAVKRLQLSMSQAEGKLLELQELIKRQKFDLAMLIFRDYKFMNLNFYVRLDKAAMAELRENVVDIVKEQIQQIKVLTAVESALIDQKKFDFRNEVELVRQQNLSKLVNSLNQMPETLPMEVSYDLKDLFESYLSARSEDARFIIPILDSLVKKNKQINFNLPDEGLMPDNLGVVVIMEKESTPNVQAVVKK